MIDKKRSWAQTLQATFLTGLLVLAPLAVTTWVLLAIYEKLRGLSPFGFWGGTAVTLVAILLFVLLIGWLSRSALGSLLTLMDDILMRVPGVSFIYGSVRDLVKAFGGEQKAFTHPVWIQLAPKMRMIGFITRDDLDSLGAKGDVAVYLPHSYAISGMVVFIPRKSVKPVKTHNKDVFAFLATGGMSGINRDK